MTMFQFALVLLFLAILLGWLLLNLGRQLKESRGKPLKLEKRFNWPLARSARTSVSPAIVEPEPAPSEPEALFVAEARPGRRRKIAPVSSGGGDPGAATKLLTSGLYAEIETKLEQAFDLLERGRISLNRYEAMIQKEQEAVKRARARFEARHMAGSDTRENLELEREEVETAEVAVQWCLDWIDDLRRSRHEAV